MSHCWRGRIPFGQALPGTLTTQCLAFITHNIVFAFQAVRNMSCSCMPSAREDPLWPRGVLGTGSCFGLACIQVCLCRVMLHRHSAAAGSRQGRIPFGRVEFRHRQLFRFNTYSCVFLSSDVAQAFCCCGQPAREDPLWPLEVSVQAPVLVLPIFMWPLSSNVTQAFSN